MKRRWRIGLAVGVVVVAAAFLVGGSALHTNEFSFLDRYHPRIEPLGPELGRADDKFFLYVFDRANAAEVLPTLERELTKRAYVKSKVGLGRNWFVTLMKPGSKGPVGASYYPPEGVKGFDKNFKKKYNIHVGDSMVWIGREPTWIERQVDAVKKFLHFE